MANHEEFKLEIELVHPGAPRGAPRAALRERNEDQRAATVGVGDIAKQPSRAGARRTALSRCLCGPDLRFRE